MKAENDFSRLEINLQSCVNNYRYFRSHLQTNTKMLVLVKANAYGHGAAEFASIMEEIGADYLAVALPIEGVELRKAGISLPILVLTAGTDFLEEIVDNDLEIGIPNMRTLEALVKLLGDRRIKDFPVHIKLDTGMHRLGFMPNEIPELLSFLASCDNVRVKSIYSHLSASEDRAADEFTLAQISLFKREADKMSKALTYRPMYHILNSAGIERFPEYQFDMVRLGIGLYGISALPDVKLSPVASLKCKILQIKHLSPQDGNVGYGLKGQINSDKETIIATLPVGYADGIDRRLGCGNISFLLNGHKVPTIGNICMDMCMIDISAVPSAKVGDTVVIFGDEQLSISDIANALGTIPYEVMTSVHRRIERVITRKGGKAE